MKLVNATHDPDRRGGIERVLRVLRESGFDGVDLTLIRRDGSWYTDTAAYLRAVRASGLPALQAHAPFPGRRFADPDYDAEVDPLVRHAIRVAGEAGAGTIVVHPIHCPTLTAAEQMEWNLDYYDSLAPLARTCGVKIALENMWGVGRPDHMIPNVCSLPDEFSRYFDALDPEVFTCCLDLGHFSMLGCPAGKAIREMGHRRVGALHVHDNNAIHDEHNLPYFGQTDWEDVAKALAEIDYTGHFTFEPDALSRLPEEAYEAGQRLAVSVGRYLIGRVEFYRQQLAGESAPAL